MDTLGNAMLGLLFLLLSLAGTILMFKLWGYPFDHKRLKSSAPPKLMLLHRLIGYAYAAIYLFLMSEMVPRLWSYEVEFPARTVAHFILGLSIGVILLVKVLIVRFFKYLESTLVPFLGTALFLCTFLLIGLSVPFAMKEIYLHETAVGGTAFSAENMERVGRLFPRAELPPEVDLKELVTVGALKEGRGVLLEKCVQCHDLRTVLAKPRTPQNWAETVGRMADRAVFNPITEEEQWRVTAYLIAISPELQKSFKQKREQDMASEKSKTTALAVGEKFLSAVDEKRTFDIGNAKTLFEEICSQCHGLKNIEKSPPATRQEALELVTRMVENGLEATEQDVAEVVFYLTETYAGASGK